MYCFVPTAIEMSVGEIMETLARYIPSSAAEPPGGTPTMSDGTSALTPPIERRAWRGDTPGAAPLAVDGKDVERTAARRQSHDACATTAQNFSSYDKESGNSVHTRWQTKRTSRVLSSDLYHIALGSNLRLMNCFIYRSRC
jgi:hypothetical protein